MSRATKDDRQPLQRLFHKSAPSAPLVPTLPLDAARGLELIETALWHALGGEVPLRRAGGTDARHWRRWRHPLSCVARLCPPRRRRGIVGAGWWASGRAASIFRKGGSLARRQSHSAPPRRPKSRGGAASTGKLAAIQRAVRGDNCASTHSVMRRAPNGQCDGWQTSGRPRGRLLPGRASRQGSGRRRDRRRKGREVAHEDTHPADAGAASALLRIDGASRRADMPDCERKNRRINGDLRASMPRAAAPLI